MAARAKYPQKATGSTQMAFCGQNPQDCCVTKRGRKGIWSSSLTGGTPHPTQHPVPHFRQYQAFWDTRSIKVGGISPFHCHILLIAIIKLDLKSRLCMVLCCDQDRHPSCVNWHTRIRDLCRVRKSIRKAGADSQLSLSRERFFLIAKPSLNAR